MMTIKEMFTDAYFLPTDNYGYFKVNDNDILHMYHSGIQINIIENDEVCWNLIDYKDRFSAIPVVDGSSRWEKAISFNPEDDVNLLPKKITEAFTSAGIL